MTPADFEFLQGLIRDRSAIVLETGKEYLLEARLEPLCRQKEIEDIPTLVRQLKTQARSPLEEAVVEAMTTNETSFFRDQHPFRVLKDNVLPEMMKRRDSLKSIRIWCAAASSGQESYSIGMTVKKDLPALEGWNVKILGTDISKNILERAQSGIYSQLEVNRGLPIPYLMKFFKQDGKTWVINDEVRRLTEFKFMNLIGTWPPLMKQDIIFIRNVLIYFDMETKKKIFERIREVLAPDGYLFLGGSESTFGIDDNFQRVEFDAGACYQLKEDS